VSGQAGFTGVGGFASNGYGAASPGGYSLSSAFLIEVVLTAGFLVVILGATAPGAHAMAAPIAIGLALTLIHLVSIPVTNTSVNPARSTGVALFADGPALAQLWLFWLAPLVGGALGAVLWKVLAGVAPAAAPGAEPA
jgi:aquaporin Z